ncbi:MAG: hypothetical protein KKA68_20955 [Gammaproteobacteria bacterium]|nr:hypothetical protein [Gammaproteobacteria bacterium]
MKYLTILCALFVLFGTSFADDLVQKVQLEPLSTGISISTVRLGEGWVTAPSVAMRGRKEMSILNTSTTENIYLAQASGATVTYGTVTRAIYPREEIFLKMSSDMNIYVSGDTVFNITVTEIK